MEHRRNLWRSYLMGNNIEHKRHLFYTFIQNKDCTAVPKRIVSTIKKDMPRTYKDIPIIQENIPIIERLLTVYSATQTGDSYLQGFNFIMSILWYVFRNTLHVEADTWWCFSGVVSRIRPLMPDFNMTWFSWCSRHWRNEFHARFKKSRPLLESIIQKHSDDFSQLVTVKWFFLWFAQSVPFEQIFVLWDFLIELEPQHLMMAYTFITLEVLNEGAPEITYNYSENETELVMAILSMRINGIEEVVRRVKARLKT